MAAIQILSALEERLGIRFADETLDVSLFASVRTIEGVVRTLVQDAARVANAGEHQL